MGGKQNFGRGGGVDILKEICFIYCYKNKTKKIKFRKGRIWMIRTFCRFCIKIFTVKDQKLL